MGTVIKKPSLRKDRKNLTSERVYGQS